MKKLFYLFILIFMAVSVAAEGFSPSNIVYLLEPNQELCQPVSITSDSEEITVFDVWAEGEAVEWNVNLFNATAAMHGLAIDYPSELLIEERDVDVCISGSKLGEYHGAIIFRQEQEGNSIVQFAVWLKVIIEEPRRAEALEDTSSGGSSANDNDDDSSDITSKEVVQASEGDKEIEYLAASEESQGSAETEEQGQAIAGDTAVPAEGKLKFLWIILPIIFVLGLVIVLYNQKKNRGNLTFDKSQFRV